VGEQAAGLQFWLPPTDATAGDTAAAESLFATAKTDATSGKISDAYQRAFESLHVDPNFAPARQFLGYVKFRDAWRTPFEVRQLSAGKVWHPQFGWLPADYVARYERGERYYRGRWMSAETEAKLRADINQGWRVESEHYSVLTNHSLQAGVELSEKLERLHAVWSQLFAGYVIDQIELIRRFQGKPPRDRGIKRHQVVYYKSRDEYNAALRKEQPKIDKTLGIYFDTERTAYFFADDKQDAGTLWHEATHQLFSESRPVVRDVGRTSNFWVVEAVACYMESLEEHLDEGYVTLGEPNAGRFPAACKRLIVDDFYVPLAELTPLGMQDLQADTRIASLYSQCAGLATFFIQADNSKYREPFVGYLRAVYDGRANPNALAQIMKRGYGELDAEYRTWMEGFGVQGSESSTTEPPAAENAEPSDPDP
jgi:hypothetical protein